MSSKGKSSDVAGGMATLVPKLRFPEFVGQPIQDLRLADATNESTERNGSGQTSSQIMGVSKVEGIVPMEERIVAADTARYKFVRKDWFAYNPMRINIGSIARWQGDDDILVSPDYVVFKCKSSGPHRLDPNYLDHFRRSDAWEDFVSEKGDGSVRVRIYYKDLARLQLALPSFPEQQKIADCLDSVDALIKAQARKVEALKAHKKGLMQQLFPQDGETQPRLRFPEFDGEGAWEEVKLQAACNMQAGKFVAAPEIQVQSAEGLFPCYGGNGLRGYTTSFTHSGKYPLIGRQGALCGNVKLGVGKFHATEHAVVASPKNGISVDWLFYLLDHLDLNQFATGQAQPGLSVDVLNNVMTSIPQNEVEQKSIADCLTSLDDLIAAETRKLDTLRTHKKGLMQRLFPQVGEDDV